MALAGWLKRRPRPQREEVALVKELLRVHLALGPDDELTVSEIVCPACGPEAVESVALVMRAGEATVALKSPHALRDVAAEPRLVESFGADSDLHGG